MHLLLPVCYLVFVIHGWPSRLTGRLRFQKDVAAGPNRAPAFLPTSALTNSLLLCPSHINPTHPCHNKFLRQQPRNNPPWDPSDNGQTPDNYFESLRLSQYEKQPKIKTGLNPDCCIPILVIGPWKLVICLVCSWCHFVEHLHVFLVVHLDFFPSSCFDLPFQGAHAPDPRFPP